MLRVRWQWSDFCQHLEIVIEKENKNGQRLIVAPLKFEELSQSMVIEEPTLRINFMDKEQYLAFFKDWIFIGKQLQLNLQEDFTKEKEALKNHLADMQHISMKFVEQVTKVRWTGIKP